MITFPSIVGANGLPFVMQTLTHPAATSGHSSASFDYP
jgi:hypothetical protein